MPRPDLTLMHPDRKHPKYRPLKALHHMRMLIADKEDTDQVFRIIQALDGGAVLRNFKNFTASKNGQERLDEFQRLAQGLDARREEWLLLPQNSFGRQYVNFMEAEGLTAMGLVEESEKRPEYKAYDDLIQWFIERLRDTHDLFHVLSGYGRDALGEAALLGFSHRQYYKNSPGFWFIHHMAAREIKKDAPNPKLINSAMKQARDNGEKASKILEQDLVALFPLPIDEVRYRLGINAPTLYYEARDSVCNCTAEIFQDKAGAQLNIPQFA